LSKTIGDDGAIVGSTVTIGEGATSGIPNDTEIVTTKSRLKNLK